MKNVYLVYFTCKQTNTIDELFGVYSTEDKAKERIRLLGANYYKNGIYKGLDVCLNECEYWIIKEELDNDIE